MPWLAASILPALLTLALVYRSRQSGKLVKLGSTFLLAKVTSPLQRQKVRLPLRYFFEALIVLLMLLVASGIQFTRSTRTIAIVVDTSMSMGARVGDENQSVLALVSDLVAQDTADMRAAHFILAEWNDGLYVRSENRLSRAELLGQLNQLQVQLAPSQESALSGVERLKAGQVYVYTDAPIQFSESENSDTIVTARVPESLKSSQNNIAISAVRTGTTPDQIEVQIQSFSAEPVSSVLEVLTLTDADEWQLGKREEIQIPAGENVHHRISVQGPVGLRLIPKVHDALDVDNVAFYASQVAPQSLVFVSPDPDVRREVESLRVAGLSVLDPQAFQDVQDLQISGLLAHRFMPQHFDGSRMVLVAPPELPTTLRFVEVRNEQDIPITSYEQGHSLLRYISPVGLQLGSALVFSGIPRTRSLINSERGSLVFSTQVLGAETIVIGLELFPLESDAGAISAVMLLNAVSWLRESVGSSATAGADRFVSNSGQSFITLPELAAVGRAGGVLRQEQGIQARNVFLPEESDLVRRNDRYVGLSAPSDSTGQVEEAPIRLPFYAALLFLVFVLVEGVVLRVKKRKQEGIR
jgi:hypothetical protein